MASAKQIANLLKLTLHNCDDARALNITGAMPLAEASNGDISFCGPRVTDIDTALIKSHASLIIIDEKVTLPSILSTPYIISRNARLDFMRVLEEFFSPQPSNTIHPSSIIATSANIAKNVSIGANSTIGANVTIESNCQIHPGVHIYDNVKIGENTIIHSGAIIGSDGFGFERGAEESGVTKFPHIGGVIIGNNVEIMACTNVSRGTLSNTVIGDETKIDSGCHIAHNVQIGKRCLITAHAMIAGSVTVADDVYIAPSVSIINKIRIENNAFIGMCSFVKNNVPAGSTVWGSPAKVMKKTT